MKQLWRQANRIVIKIGSALLVDEKTGNVHRQWLNGICEEIAELWQKGKEIILVSSGSVAIGRRLLQLSATHCQLEQQQAAASVGQIRLAHAYQEIMSKHHISVAQILLTLEDSENRQRYLNAVNTLETLLGSKVIPIINENDTVATSELRYGDNDRLSARIAQMVSANVLVLLSDIDGLYTADPRKDANAELIPVVHTLSSEIEAMGQGPSSAYGTGGMKTKLAAAGIAMACGCNMVICKGQVQKPLVQLNGHGRCTWFLASISPRNARKNWLAHHLQPKGNIIIDEGAYQALKNGKSLLSAGVSSIEGEFKRGDPVRILTEERLEIGRGLCNYHTYEARLIMGKKSEEFEQTLGYPGTDEMIHRNNLVIL